MSRWTIASSSKDTAASSDADAAFLSHVVQIQNEVVGGAMEPSAVMQRIVECSQELSGASGAALELIDGDELVYARGCGNMLNSVGMRMPLKGSLLSHSDSAGRPLYSSDTETDPRVNREVCRRLGMRSMIVVPLMHDGRLVGVLQVNSEQADAFTDRDVWGLRVMNGLLAAAMTHAAEFDRYKSLLEEHTVARAALNISEARFRQAFESSPIGMAIVELNGKWTRVNRALCTMLGYSEAELQQINVQALTHVEDQSTSAMFRTRLIDGKLPEYTIEKRYIHRSGQIVWAQLNVSLARDAAGAPLHFISQIEDITERRKTREALRDSETAYRTLFDLAGVGMAHVDANTQRFIRVNRKLCEITGYSADELLLLSTRDITHPDDQVTHDKRFKQLTEGPSGTLSYEKRYIHKSGRDIWLAISSTTFSSGDGEPRHLVAMLQDITEQRRAEETLRVSESRYRTLTNQVPVAIFQNDPAGNNLFVNDRWCRMTGLTADQAHGPGWMAAVHPEDRPKLIEKRAAAFAAGTEWSMQYRYISAKGQIVWVQGGAAPLRDDAGSVIGFLGSATDITDRKRAEWLESDRREILERVASQSPLPEILDRVALLIERQAEHCVGGLVLINDGSVDLRAPALSAGVIDALQPKLLTITAGVIARAYEQAGGIATSDIGTDPIWADVSEVLLADGLNMCWMVPILSNDSPPLGVLTVFCRARRLCAPVEIDMLNTVGRLATVAIEHHRANELLAHLVRHDRLTGLPNRMLLDDRVEHALALARRSGKSLGMIVLDIDKFKSINDTLGHQAGDQVLQAFARRFSSQLRSTDTMARLGGDEFVVVLPELTAPTDAAIVAKKLVDSLIEPLELSDQTYRVTASLGVALFPDDAMDAPTLQRRADEALYDVKARGRNGFALWKASAAA